MIARSILSASLLAAVCLAGCGSRERQPPPVKTVEPVVTEAAPASDDELLEQLALLTMGVRVDAALGAGAKARWLAELRGGTKTIAAFIDATLTSREFFEDVAPRVVVSPIYFRRPSPFALGNALQTTGEGAQKVYYLGTACKPEEAIKVKPWWDLDNEVLVCPGAYQPGDYRIKLNGTWEYCGSTLGKPCGCGPNLIRCSGSADQEERMRDEHELELTVAHVVKSDLPLASLFTMNETVRDWEDEVFYRRTEVATSAAEDLTPLLREIATWKQPALRPRNELWPGQHAGILTTLQVMRTAQDARQTMRAIYEMMWCSTVESRGADAHAVLSLGKSSLQGLHEGWQDLARRPVCTSCHARLDFGIQFFRGYADPRSPGAYAMPELVRKGDMDLYGDDIDDPRGKAIATPSGFGHLATKQPEFASCMSQRVTGHVFGHEASTTDRAKIRAAYDAAPTLRNLMKTALTLYAEHWASAHAGTVAAAAPAHGPDPKKLRGMLETYCFDCHDAERKPDLTVAEPTPELLFNVATQVAYGGMPKGEHSLTNEARRELASLALSAALAGRPPEAQRDATAYFERAYALTVHDIDDAFSLIDLTARGADAKATPTSKNKSWSLYERGQDYDLDARQWTPSFAAATGFKALEACKAQQLAGDQLDACLAKVLDPTLLAKTTRPITRGADVPKPAPAAKP